MPLSVSKDPYRAYNFRLIVGDNSDARFMRCSGMEITVNTVAYRESGNSQLVRKLPGQVEYAPIVLQYGLTDSDALWKWFMSSVNGAVERKNVTIQLLDTTGAKVVMIWDLINAWPSQWKGAELDAMTDNIAIESLVLTFESLEKKSGEGNA